jgi:hypothetical protein
VGPLPDPEGPADRRPGRLLGRVPAPVGVSVNSTIGSTSRTPSPSPGAGRRRRRRRRGRRGRATRPRRGRPARSEQRAGPTGRGSAHPGAAPQRDPPLPGRGPARELRPREHHGERPEHDHGRAHARVGVTGRGVQPPAGCGPTGGAPSVNGSRSRSGPPTGERGPARRGQGRRQRGQGAGAPAAPGQKRRRWTSSSPRSRPRSTSTQPIPRDSASTRACGLTVVAANSPRTGAAAGRAASARGSG